MSPSMPINIATPASSASSVASSPSSSSSSSSGVYVPVHRRTPSDLSSRAASKPKRTLPIYTPAELMQLAQSPLAKEISAVTHAALHGQEDLAAIALSKRQQRSREYMQRKNEEESKKVVVVAPVPATRRRPVGRVAERNSNSRRSVTSKFMDAASWRGQAPRHMESLPVPLAV
ncbi:hypothetical protein B0H19DRAFT_1100399 [Mycena capillaripes]|nr:hypothetical protein B0H19DRAFT_1100399 [Mycena capillaripes]